MSDNEKTNSDNRSLRDPYADSGAADFDMSPEAIERRLRTVGQLNRVARYLAKGIVLGPVNKGVAGNQTNE
jgi:hypothetical protein